MRLSVIIPAYNEAATILETIRRVRRAGRERPGGGPGLDLEILVVDDASTDDTARLAAGAAAGEPGETPVRLIRHPVNRGKGAAIRTALREAGGDAVIIQDADLEYDPGDYHELVETMRQTGAGAVYGSRILGRNPHSYLRYYWGGRLLTFLFNALYGTRLTDLTTCYKMFRRETIQGLPLSCERFEFCPEVTARLVRRGVAIREVPIAYRPRSIQEGKKIRWHDGLTAMRVMVGLRWRRRV